MSAWRYAGRDRRKTSCSRRLARLLAALMMSTAGLASATPPAPDFAAAAERVLADYTARSQFSGYALVAHQGEPVFARAFGFADADARRLATGGTRFRISSITKHFTATAVLLLATEGKLKLDAPVREYYLDAPAAWNAITVRHVLEFRSGLFNLTNAPGFMALAARNPTPGQQLELVRDLPLDFAPGSRFAYNNTDPVLLGYIVERVSGMTYRQFIETRVLAAAGLAGSGYDYESLAPEQRATGYEWQTAAWRPARLLSSNTLFSAGALYSTAEDLLRWDQMLYGEAPLAKVLRDAEHELREDQPFRFGFFVEPFAGRPSRYAGGAQPGFSSFVYRFPDDRVTLILLSNAQSVPVLPIAQQLARLYFGTRAPEPPKRVAIPVKLLDRYVGTYELYPGARLVLSRKDGDLYLTRVGGMPPPPARAEALLPVARGVFLGEDCRIEFDATPRERAPVLRYTIPRLKTERPARRIEDEGAPGG